MGLCVMWKVQWRVHGELFSSACGSSQLYFLSLLQLILLISQTSLFWFSVAALIDVFPDTAGSRFLL